MTEPLRPARLALLISGRGRNLQAIADAVRDGRIAAEIAAVVSNRADAPGLAFARERGLPTHVVAHVDYPDRARFDSALAACLRDVQPDFVALAGFMRVLGADFVSEFQGRMLNIHPSLLPKYPGLNTHRRVLEDGDGVHGATVHFVSSEVDGGARIVQGAIAVTAGDHEVQLSERVMQEVELRIYPQAIAWLARGDLRLDSNQAIFRGRALHEPLVLDDLEAEFR